MISVRFNRGVYIPDLDFWLDPWDAQRTAFISHAHSDHIGRHREVILSSITARLMAARLPGKRTEHVLEFGELFPFRNSQITLLPAGHIYGSAQIYLEIGQGSLLYTGDFKLRNGKSAEAVQWRPADTLIMETTYGLPRYSFPPTEQVIAELVKFCAEALEDQEVPVLFGYSLGKAQEILAALHGSGFQIRLHPAVYRMTQLYSELHDRLPPFSEYAAGELTNSVLICPPGANRTRLVQKIPRRRTAALTGWALNPGAAHRYQCDAVFPLSDHADYPDLIRYVELVKPRRVFTLHGFAHEFASDLRQRGIEAWALGSDNQLEFGITVAPALTSRLLPAPDANPVDKEDFARFAMICGQIEKSTGKSLKVRILKDYLGCLEPSDLPIVCTFFTGHPFSRSDGRILQTGWSIIRKALMKAAALTESQFRRISAGYGDIGKVAYEVLLGRTRQQAISVRDIFERFSQLESAKGPIAKADYLGTWLAEMDAESGSCVVRILTGDLRIGLKEGLLEEGIAAAFEVDGTDVREAHMLVGDLGATAVLASQNQLSTAQITLFRPVRCMLAIPAATSDDLFQRVERDFPAGQALAEPKYDGIRAQIHADTTQVQIFSRDLRNISGEFGEITQLRFAEPVILDGEILAYGDGRKLTFFDLQKRLGRKRETDLFEISDIPIIYVAFDLLWSRGRSLTRVPLQERRSELAELRLPALIRVAPGSLVRSAEEIESAFGLARKGGAEGLMIKDPGSFYQPGRRGGSWIKYKKELATLDVVVVGAEYGSGKRSHVLSDYTFAVRNANTGVLQTIGKAYSGLTDAEIERLTEHFTATTLRSEGRYRVVNPEIVLEIAFDSIQKSARHSSGLALRFPRIKAIRDDKTANEIDTVQYALRLSGLENSGS